MRSIILVSVFIAGAASAQASPPSGGAPAGPPQMIAGIDYAPFFAAADVDGNKTLSPQEWTKLGIADRAYTLFAGSSDNALTLTEMNDTGSFPGMDADGDKKVTLKEFQDFDTGRRNMAPGGPPPGGMPKSN